MLSRSVSSACCLALFLLGASASAQELGDAPPIVRIDQRPLDHADYDRWQSIRGETLSADGNWVHYTLSPGGEGDDTLVIQSLTSERRFEVLRGGRARFTRDARFVVYTVSPDSEALEQAKKDKVPPNEQPKSSCEILDLRSGEVVRIPRVKRVAMPEEGAPVVAILLEEPLDAEDPAVEDKTPSGEFGGEAPSVPQPSQEPGEAVAKKKTASSPSARAAEPEKTGEPAEKKAGEGQEVRKAASGEKDEKKKEPKKKPAGSELIVRVLDSGTEHRFQNVEEVELAEDGDSLVIATALVDERPGGVHRISPRSGERALLHEGSGEHRSIAIDESGECVAFLFRPGPPEAKDDEGEDREEGAEEADEEEEPKAPWELYWWRAGEPAARSAIEGDRSGWPAGWEISERRSPSFSKSGERLLFGIAPPRLEEPKRDEDEPEVKVDIWHWRDPLLQPQQLRTVSRERGRSYLAVAQPLARRVVVLADEAVPDVEISREGDGRWALGSTNLPYQKRISWDSPRYYDHYLIDLETGRRELILEDLQASADLSPEGRFVTWWDGAQGHWLALSVEDRETINLTAHLPHPVENLDQDTPSLRRGWGRAGWVEGDQMFLVYDRHDVWATSPAGFWPPMCITDGIGRERGIRFRYVSLDRDQEAIPLEEPLLLSAFDLETKGSGYFRDRVRSSEKPRQLVMAAARFSSLQRAEDAERLMFTRERFEQFPDLWISDLDFGGQRRITDANPQQEEYTWGTAELYDWTSLDGEALQGILIKPDGFDPRRRYPMIVYFYEKSSDNLHRYVAPAPARASVNYSFYVSRGYLVFVPDIPYRVGYPGLSALNAIVPGVTSLIDEGFVDKARIGVQGHSWGGYQVAYLVTRTNLFAAAEAGAPVSNMISAYGGIRWGSGMSRMFQYERTQSRIGGTLWEKTLPFIENSPIFWLENVETPLLILHNDEDGAVPWYQGIELFVGLRRLGKAAWLFNYNGEQHGLTRDHNRRDWSVRMQQFFDHYLQDAPPPVWLDRGVPALAKGRDLGLDLIGAEEKTPAALAQQRKAEHDRKLNELLGEGIVTRKIRYASGDGLEVPAYRFSVLETQGRERRPALVWLHGEETFDAERYLPWLKEAVQRGYVVLAPDYRGSTGYGAEYKGMRDPGAGDVADARAAVEVLANDERVDAARIAALGWGSGGAIALHLATGPEAPIRCAAALSPYADLVFHFALAEPAEQRRWLNVPALAGGPGAAPEEWLRRSVVQRAGDLSRPVLVHHASDDEVVTCAEVDRLTAVLAVRDDIQTETQCYPDAGGHYFNRQIVAKGESPPEAQADSWERIWQFLGARLEWTAPDAGGE